MNTKTALGLVIALVILVVAFFAFHTPAKAPTSPETATSTEPASASTSASVSTSTPTPGQASAPASTLSSHPSSGSIGHAPSVTAGTPTPVRIAAFDQSSLTSNSSRPTITGTANVSAVALVLDNPAGVGIAGSSNIPVVQGHWSFTAPQMLAPGTYTLHLLGGAKEETAALVVTQ